MQISEKMCMHFRYSESEKSRYEANFKEYKICLLQKNCRGFIVIWQKGVSLHKSLQFCQINSFYKQRKTLQQFCNTFVTTSKCRASNQFHQVHASTCDSTSCLTLVALNLLQHENIISKKHDNYHTDHVCDCYHLKSLLFLLISGMVLKQNPKDSLFHPRNQ